MGLFTGNKKIQMPLKLVLWLNFFFVFFLLLAYSASYFDPSVFPYIALVGMAYLPILFINLLFILFWIYFRPLQALYSIATILIGWTIFGAHFQLHKNTVSKPDELKIVSYNVRNFYNYLPDSEHSKSQENAVLTFLKEQNAELVCLQEFLLKNKRFVNDNKQFGKKIGLNHFYYRKYLSRKKKSRIGLMTYSKYPIIKEDYVEYNEKTVALITDILRNKDTIRVFNLHLASIYFGGADYQFLKELDTQNSKEKIKKASNRILQKLLSAFRIRAKEVDLVTALIQKSPYPIILCGDFNDTPLSYTYQEISSLLKDSFREAGRGLATTFSASYLPPIRIDYIFHSKDFKANYFSVFKKNYSDHYPIVSSLTNESIEKEK